jgi:penicillin-binding protein 2
MFVCFAPKENPRIAIAVAVENAGFGATWGGPIARILMEKYLNDTIQEKSKADVERISTTNLMPKYYVRKQFIEDSIRAYKWFQMTKDSAYIEKYVFERSSTPGSGKNKDQRKQIKKESLTIWIDKRANRQKQFTNPV